MNEMLPISPYILFAILFWTLPWKAWALWLSARRGDFWWFFSLLILNTLAILDIVYIFFVAKQSDKIKTKTDSE
jgi:hypothetical protein